jgi:predicted NodU family carbamoyl transferase
VRALADPVAGLAAPPGDVVAGEQGVGVVGPEHPQPIGEQSFESGGGADRVAGLAPPEGECTARGGEPGKLQSVTSTRLLRESVADGSLSHRRARSWNAPAGERRPSPQSSPGSPNEKGPATVDIVSYNPGHDGAVVHLRDGYLVSSVEAEKDSNYRYTPISSRDLLDAFGRLEQLPDVVCTGGWWPREARPTGSPSHVGYRGIAKDETTVEHRRLVGKSVPFFSSSHERSHLLCGFGMSPFPQGSPCYALVWEGAIGAFYEIDPDMNITLIADVMNEPGNRYASIYGLADPTFPKNAPFSRFSDAGKLMALASFSKRGTPTAEEEELMAFLLSSEHVRLDLYDRLESSAYYNVGTDDTEFRNFAGIFSDRIFDTFYRFAKANLRKSLPLVIAGGCGLNCDWNSKWRETGIFSEVFVPPVANDSGSAIGTAIDAQLHFTGDAKIKWDVYSGLPFRTDSPVVPVATTSETRVTMRSPTC